MSQVFGRFFGAPGCSRKDHVVRRVRWHQNFETKVDTLDLWQLEFPGSFTVGMNALEVELLCRVRSSVRTVAG